MLGVNVFHTPQSTPDKKRTRANALTTLTPQPQVKKRAGAISSTIVLAEYATPIKECVKRKSLAETLEYRDPSDLFGAIVQGMTVRRSKDRNPEEGRPNSAYYRKIYTEHCGEIPEGFEVHHIDMNSQNCLIENLVAIPLELHHKLHSTQYAQEKIIFWLKNPESYKLCSKNDIKIILDKVRDLPETLREYRDYILSRNKILIERYGLSLPPVSDITDIVNSLFTLRSERTPYLLRNSSPQSKKHVSRLPLSEPMGSDISLLCR